jgi:AraC family transcriptional regulator of arabinose operon
MEETRIRMDKTIEREAPTARVFEQRGHHHMAADLPRRWIVLPRDVRSKALSNPLLRGLLPSHVGFFPDARHHRVHRPEGLDQAIFNYCVKGTGWCEVGAGRRFEVGPGELMVVPARAPHAYGATPNRPWTVHWFHAAGQHVELLLRELGATSKQPVVYLGKNARLVALFRELERSLEHDYSSAQLLYASQLLAHLLGLMIHLRRTAVREAPGAAQRVLQSATEMRRRIDLAMDVSELASLASLSPSHYSALFRSLTGYSPKHYLTRLRIHRAAQLLRTTHLSVKTVAAMLGYADPLYFSRTFRLIHGICPSDYREVGQGKTPLR